MKSLFTSQPPWTFTLGMSIYHLLPLHAPITLFLTDAPFGRFASDSKSRWQVDGNKSWFIMEIVSPLTLLATLCLVPRPAWSTSSTILTSLFLVHYLHRAILSPLVYSPARSKQHVIVPIIAGIYNLLNGHCIAIGLSHYGSNSLGPRYWLSVAGWAIGFAGNVYHDEVLNDLRRPTEKQLFTTAHPKELEKDKEASGGRYAIPRGGLFKYVSFPNYSCEWFEWLCFSMAAAPNPLMSTPALSTLPEWLQRLFASTYYPSRLLHPSWMFFIFLLSSMYPRAVRSHRWYKGKFGDRYPDRKVVIPFVL